MLNDWQLDASELFKFLFSHIIAAKRKLKL
jgi:hypothetical protein